ncbi:hypothetical protein EXIGLDRAFT_836563 [Exidia glandulosa HHB12029]|uniref:C2H2-type domain-containing protein n=1 Tax=Exidia glandulosa HHB12029 TaxID=1314781 RepID=A0A165HPJ2_EXIGL|nr:hypothetical protein EXIGLDRAFT_836563 [Exidia glandulosa HHB12029]
MPPPPGARPPAAHIDPRYPAGHPPGPQNRAVPYIMPPGAAHAYQQQAATSGQRSPAPQQLPGRGYSLPHQATAGYHPHSATNPYAAPYAPAPTGPANGEYIILRPQVRSGSLQVAASSNRSLDSAMAAYRAHEVQRAREQPRFEDLSEHESDEGRTEAEIIAVRMARASSTPMFACPVHQCDKRYTFASNLRRHIRTAHPEIAGR